MMSMGQAIGAIVMWAAGIGFSAVLAYKLIQRWAPEYDSVLAAGYIFCVGAVIYWAGS
jgi:hypothetical protein